MGTELEIADVVVRESSGHCLLKPVSDQAKAWIKQHIDLTEAHWWGEELFIEGRYASPILEHLVADGLYVVIQGENSCTSAMKN